MISIQQASAAAKQYFGFDDFREGQSSVIASVLAGNDTVVVMPTGSGKSLCFQLPAMLLPGATIVVSPLIALMKDQVDSLAARGLPATFINSSLTPNEQRERIAALRSGSFKLVYIAPERFRSPNFVSALAQSTVSLFAVDEAHCVSHWGHDFRPDYLRLKQAAIDMGRPPIVALTATATSHVRADISEQLGLHEPRAFVSGFDRSNLELHVVHVGGIRDKVSHLRNLVRQHKTGIIYTATRKAVDQLRNKLAAAGVNTLAYHAGMSDDDRNLAQNRFMSSGQNQVIVATNAFGMGIDKPDIRFVAHFQMPGSIEAYYQEIGRAGRDGKPAVCSLLFNYADKGTHDFFIEGSFPTPEIIVSVYNTLAATGLKTINLSVSEIAARSGTRNEMSVNSALTILERAGHIERTSGTENQPSLKLRVSLKAASEVVGLSGSTAKNVLRYLIQVYDLNQQNRVQIDVEAVSRNLGMETAEIRRVLSVLATSGIIDFETGRRSRAVTMLDAERQTQLRISSSDIAKRAAFEQRKLREMIRFCYDEECRWNFILDYFGEPHRRSHCGRCDICVANYSGPGSRVPQSTRPPSQLDQFVSANRPSGIDLDSALEVVSKRKRESQNSVARAGREVIAEKRLATRDLTDTETLTIRKILACAARMNRPTGRTMLTEVLRGSNSSRIKEEQLDKLSTHGILSDLSKDYVLMLIDSLTEAGALTLSSGTFPQISITQLGKDVMREKQKIRLNLVFDSPAVESAPVSKPKRAHTSMQTFDLYAAGNSIEEIAAARGLSQRTIEEHLVQCIHLGIDVDIEKSVSQSEKTQVERAIAECGVELLSPLREILPESVTWRAIKLVAAEFRAKNGASTGDGLANSSTSTEKPGQSEQNQ